MRRHGAIMSVAYMYLGRKVVHAEIRVRQIVCGIRERKIEIYIVDTAQFA